MGVEGKSADAEWNVESEVTDETDFGGASMTGGSSGSGEEEGSGDGGAKLNVDEGAAESGGAGAENQECARI